MYYVHNKQTIIFVHDETSVSFIPMDEQNTDYQTYLDWVAKGNTATEWITKE
jgi:hypothetical protein